MIQNCGLVHSIDREKLYQLILQQEFIQNRASDPMFILDETIFQITGCTYTTMKKFPNEIIKVYT